MHEDDMHGGRPRYWGKYKGIVLNNVDPKGLGRLQVQVGSVAGLGDLWALPCVPYAGFQQGFFALPDPGTNVWVEFERGDPEHPIWVGCFWKTGDLSKTDALPNIKMLKTKGVTLRIDELKQELVISTASSSITIDLLKVEIKGPRVNSKAGLRSTNLNSLGFDVNKGGLKVT